MAQGETQVWALDRAVLVLATVEREQYWYEAGHAHTAHGTVGIYIEDRGTWLSMVHRGRMHREHVGRTFSTRGLKSVCTRFARRVVEGG